MSMGLRTIKDVINSLPSPPVRRCIAPQYTGQLSNEHNVGLCVESMRHHMSDEGWQIFQSLEYTGYLLYGYGLPQEWGCNFGSTDVNYIIGRHVPKTVVVQDKREWDVKPRDFREPKAKFTNVDMLRHRPDVFKLTIVKDAQHNPQYHKESAEEIGCHAWIIYYHPEIVCHLAPYIRREHVVRTYHTIDSESTPAYDGKGRKGALLSGALSNAYPLRKRIHGWSREILQMDVRPHPGYHRRGTDTPSFLSDLSKYKVAICTSSIYGYALRKIIEATACGCKVITDLPVDEVLPYIDSNLLRVNPDISLSEIRDIINQQCDSYDPAEQDYLAGLAKQFYDYRSMGRILANDIERMRVSYNV